MENKPIFDPELCQCPKCETLLRSRWPGDFVSCECRDSFVDQTQYYSRYGGCVESVENLILKDFTDISGIYSSIDVLGLISEIMLKNSIDGHPYTWYSSSQNLLGGMSIEFLVNSGKGHKVVAFLEAVLNGDLP